MRTNSPPLQAKRPMRPRELQDPLNYYLYHPLAWQFARLLARTPITPNMVSVLGAGCVVAAGLAYTQLAWPVSAALGMALHMTWHVVDGADNFPVRYMLNDASVKLGIPVVLDVEIGHVAPRMPLVNGAPAHLVVDGEREPGVTVFAFSAVASCTAELIQDDPGGLAKALALPIPVIPLELPSYQKKENWGASETFYQIVRNLCAPRAADADFNPRSCNVLGPTALGFRHRDDLAEIMGLLGRLGITVNVADTTVYRDSRDDLTTFNFGSLAIGDYVELGLIEVDGVLTATRVERDDNDSDRIIKAIADSVTDVSETLVIAGVTVDASNAIYQINDRVVGADAFYAAASAGSKIKAKGSFNGTTLIASEVELDQDD